MTTMTYEHVQEVRDVEPSSDGCLECLQTGVDLGAPAAVLDLRPCRMLRYVHEQARHETLPQDSSSNHPVVRTW